MPYPEKQTTSELFKEAIADAKAVRQTALANAKVALEEAFNERYKAMFAEKLKEEAEQEDLNTTNSNVSDEFGKDSEEYVSDNEIDELIKELESEVDNTDTENKSDSTPTTPPPPPPPPIPPTAQSGNVTQGTSQVPGTVTPSANQTVAPSIGSQSQPGMSTGEVPTTPSTSTPVDDSEYNPTATQTPPKSDEPSVETVAEEEKEDEEEIDLEELLESLEKELEDEENEDKDEEDKDEDEEEVLDETKLVSSGIGESPNKQPKSSAKSSSDIGSSSCDSDACMPSIDQPKVTSEDPTNVKRPNKSPNAKKDGDTTPGGLLEENKALRQQLSEAEEVIRYVKGQLNEVNLLNAKLLYTNKLFKEYDLSNEQKMRIVEMFDLAKSVREVKLTYANTAEALNFGAGIRKKAKISANVQSITEGLASQPVGSTKPSNKEIITSASSMASRFQKLAGIKSPSK